MKLNVDEGEGIKKPENFVDKLDGSPFFLFWRSQGLLGRDRSSIPYGAIDLSSRVFLAIGERLIRRTPLNVEISGLTEPGLEPLNSWLRD